MFSQVLIATSLSAGVLFVSRARFSLLHSFKTGSGPYPASFTMGSRSSFPGVKRLGLEADLWSPYNVEVKNSGAIPPAPHVSSWRSAYFITYVILISWNCATFSKYLLAMFWTASLTIWCLGSHILRMQLGGRGGSQICGMFMLGLLACWK
jgi:hypothetical protein